MNSTFSRIVKLSGYWIHMNKRGLQRVWEKGGGGEGDPEQIKNCAKLTPGGHPKEVELYEGDHRKERKCPDQMRRMF